MSGNAVCYDVPTGKQLWQERLKGTYTASLLAAGGLVYFLNEDGNTVVVRAGATFDIMATNNAGAKAGEIFRASPVPDKGRIFLRSNTTLYCIEK